MYQGILVPLDGSPLAECVLPHVKAIAEGCGVKQIIFVRVVEPVPLASGQEFVLDEEKIRQQVELARKSDAEHYLQQLVGRLGYDGVVVQTEVILGRVAESIAEYAEKNNIDLIIIATHGRSGISRWVWGSVADRILRSACVPVLMVRAPGCIPSVQA